MKDTNKNKEVYLTNRLLSIGRSNISGVIYTKESIEKMIEVWKENDKPVFGIVHNPSSSYSQDVIDLADVASVIEHLDMDDSGLIVTQKILDTPKGLVLKHLLESFADEGATNVDDVLEVSPILTGKLDNGYHATDLNFLGVRYSSISASVKE